MRKTTVAALLAVYVLLLLDVTLLRFPQPGPPPNWIPLATIAHYCRVGGWELARNVLGNIVLFAPLGFLVPAFHPELRSARLVIGFALCVSLAIECLQYASGQRVADIDDVLLNTLGGAAGYLTCALLKRRRVQPDSAPHARAARAVVRASGGW